MAMAPEKAGIGLRRHFTAEGTHPYDEVEWERRDARITNYRDGSVAFEQRDVEFPRSWSQNATNIVAQKYFRGSLGSPERERSLRQVIDRVVDTITDWGRKDGYFVDVDETEAFRAELKHLLVHQKAAFNSPVWFNIGVAGEPQQASACQPWDALVSTPDGLIPIGALVDNRAIGAKVFDSSGLTSVVAVKANGRKTVLRVHTSAGYALDVTADHLVWADGKGFVPAGRLARGDQLEWHGTESWGDGQITREAVAEAGLAGWIQSGGFVVDVGGKGVAGGAVQVAGEAEERWLREALGAALPGLRAVALGLPAPTGSRRLRLEGTGLAALVQRWGLNRTGPDASVPDFLFTAPLPVAAGYLRSLFQAEGWLSSTGAIVGLAMSSEPMVRGVQSLLLRFGVFSKLRRVAERRAGGSDFWVLNVSVATDGHRFADEIGFIDPQRTAELDAALAKAPNGNSGGDGSANPATRLIEVESIDVAGEMAVYDIQTESGEYLSGNVRVHNCFILAVEDTMRSILNWYVEEGTIFKGGSGAGINLSTIRSSHESLKGGGAASGPVSFMRGADASAGTIKSGGKTRRAAKMVILNADHPDVEHFIWCKAVEERKARVLRDAGFDMDLDGSDSHSTQYQNANNSVRVTDEFMQAVVDDRDWSLRAVTTGAAVRTIKARDLFRQIATAAWECADPGMQFDTTINRWHTASKTGRINASNPCFPGDQLVHTDKGLIRFDALFDRARQGESFGVYTHDATNPEKPADHMELTRPEAFMVTGMNEIVRLRFDNGALLRCTPNHALFTVNRGWVAASELTEDDRVKLLDLPAPAVSADGRLPVSSEIANYVATGDWSQSIQLPEKWSPELAHYLGWLVGDGCIAGDVVTTVYGGGADQEHILPRHLEVLASINGDRAPTPSVQPNGTVQLRQSRRVIARFLEALGIGDANDAEKVVPWSIEQAPPEAVAAFLRGLFDADATVYEGADSRSEVSLGSASRPLLRGVQRLLTTFGIEGRIYRSRASVTTGFSYQRKDGSAAVNESRDSFVLRVVPASMATFAAEIGFDIPSKQDRLQGLLSRHTVRRRVPIARLVERTDDGVELTYNLCEPRNHSYVVGGVVVRNCSEYMHLDNSACNLASLNLLKFLDTHDRFDTEGFRQAAEVIFTAQEILVGNADYPTEPIAETSRRFRQLGLGYANLGAMLMALGLPYDSDGGRAWAAAITALMTGHAYATSARIASRMGPFAGYTHNAEPMNRVLQMHRDASLEIDEDLVPIELLSAAQESWEAAVELAEWFGVRNSQATVLAPTGTIGLMMDCDTTGIEPDLGLCKTKKLVGGGTMSIVNQTVPRALRRLGYSAAQVDEIIAYIDEHKTIMGAPHLSTDHLPVFACSMGDNVIHYRGHVKMMGAVQPFISGAISKTINAPEEITVEEVEQLHIDAWKLGLKAVAIYRDNCKVAQPLSATKSAGALAAEAVSLALVPTVVDRQPIRQKLPRRRSSKTFSFRVADCHGYVTVGEYEDGRPGEIFLKVAKQGSTLAGIMDAFAISVSHGLQYGVPLKAFIDMYTNMRFEPAGMTDDPDLRFASSLVDYIFRRLAVEYLPLDERAELGILTIDERMQPTLPGVEESSTPTSTGADLVPDPAPRVTAAAPAPVAAAPAPQPAASDAPYCYQCGMVMQRAGACFVCSSCGTTSGCS